MEYISAEKFLKQPKEVQDVFWQWWQPKPSDLIGKIDSDYYLVNEVWSMSKPKVSKIKIYKDYYIPLFTEGQLRKFIQDKLKDKIIATYSCDGYNISKAFDYDNEYKTKQDNLLEAYWQVACKIAKRSI